jgi:hypothetical protein
MYKRNWREFFLEALRSLKTVGVASSLVPLFFFFMNPDFSAPGYFKNLLFSTRIGFQIAMFSWSGFLAVYSFIYYKNPQDLIKIKRSVKAQISIGISFMLIGLGLTSLLEPYISGRNFGLQSISVGTLVGGTSFLLCMFYVAYKRSQEVNLKLKSESAEANLHILNNQMQPHFLFNSLNSLSELIETNNEYAAKMTQKLADLYRQILENSKNQLASLESEVSIINRYMELEKLRYDERFSYSISTPSDHENIFLPSLILQTLVENALKHGISKSIGGGNISVQISKAVSEGYYIDIINTGGIYQPSQIGGTGLSNTRARLNLLYGDKHNFNIQTSENQTKVNFWFSGAPFDV